MKKEQTQAILSGMVQIVALLNFYNDVCREDARTIIKSKSSRRKPKMTQEMVLAQMGSTTLLSTINMLAPFLVSLGINLAYRYDTEEYILLYKGNVVELTDLGRELFLDSLMKKAEKEDGLQESDNN